ncbi:MAG TPA: carboxylating nicotinate-nucleotide diphosphorylase [Gaiellaceae bacterium]|nr:carboxylating nicotinate-nucleotide diphosphorylase [Gaiellaceae bacterium]
MELSNEALDRVVAAALAEDVGTGDRTTEGTVPAEARCRAQLLLKEPGVVCGVEIARAVFQELDPAVIVEVVVQDGALVADVATLAEIEGPARAILTGERTALNLLGRLCGIATLTRQYVDLVAGTGPTILDTRKTTPGLRALEKYAVRCGGGSNHRAGLDDAILVKENHLRLAGGIGPALAALRVAVNGSHSLTIEVEAETLDEVAEALDAGVERILLDNMTPAEIEAAIELTAGRAKLEASGGITLENVRAYAETGVDFISIGALTHSARSLDVSLEIA